MVAASPALGGEPPGDGDRYENAEYAFSCAIPEGYARAKTDPAAPDHGYRLNLAADGHSVLWVDGSYNALGWQSTDDVVAANLEFLKDDGATGIRLARREPLKLDTVEGVDLTVDYESSTGLPSVLRVVVAIRQAASGDAPQIVYTLGLQTSKERYATESAVLETVVRSFTVQALP